MKSNFYDIESLENVFTLANYIPDEHGGHVDIYYLIDDKILIPNNFEQKATERIYANNINFHGTVRLVDLNISENNKELAKIFGLSDARYINNPANPSSYGPEYRIVCDTDDDYDPDIHPYLFGYNSNNYDTTMLTLYFSEAFVIKTHDEIVTITDEKGIPRNTKVTKSVIDIMPPTARTMRSYNDDLFLPRFKNSMPDRLRVNRKSRGNDFTAPDFRSKNVMIRKNMLMSGRHIDVARLNEKQSKVGLKRLLGMLGYQILESDKLRPGQDKIENSDQLLDLIAYNVSDVVNLEKLFMHKTYQSSFSLKKQLLQTYPELIYEQDKPNYRPKISKETVRVDRLTIDSSSAQFATKALCPYDHLSDYDTVSFMYPSEEKAKALGISRVNVLEESKKFFESHFSHMPEIMDQFMTIYNYYKQIEGKNFNASKNYLIDHNIDPDEDDMIIQERLQSMGLDVYNLSTIEAPNTCMFYYNADGSPSTCFVNFSTGGIHGAEYNKALYDADCEAYKEVEKAWQDKVDLFETVKQIYPNPCDLKANKGVEIDGVKYTPSTFLKPKATVTEAYYKDPPAKPKAPKLFTSKEKKSGQKSYNVDKRYSYTSAAMTNHEDFTSYYPNMLRMMDAFYNPGLGYDRYGEIFDDKTKYGHMMKDKKYSEEERALYAVMREGTKLILNSASGAGDANFESNVRMNNKIISMRIIGQMFTWRIGQAQTLEGASIISTNTDGLYSVLEATRNNEILAREAASINVEIEPEPIFLISKDSNNRTEIEVKNNQLDEIAGASGGTLACRKGPNPTKSLAHPAIIDWALCEYLTLAAVNYKDLALDKPFDDDMGKKIITSARTKFNDDIHTLIMFQNIIASSPGSQRFVFATTDADPDIAIPLQHYNRCFIVKDKTPNTVHLQQAVAKTITPATKKKRAKDGLRAQIHDPIAVEILSINGVDVSELDIDKEAALSKITNLETNWYVRVDNRDLHFMSQSDIDKILDNLDYDKYLTLLRDAFMNNWYNLTPEYAYPKEEEPVDTNLFDDTTTVSDANTTNNVANTDTIIEKPKLNEYSDDNEHITESLKLYIKTNTAYTLKETCITSYNGFAYKIECYNADDTTIKYPIESNIELIKHDNKDDEYILESHFKIQDDENKEIIVIVNINYNYDYSGSIARYTGVYEDNNPEINVISYSRARDMPTDLDECDFIDDFDIDDYDTEKESEGLNKANPKDNNNSSFTLNDITGGMKCYQLKKTLLYDADLHKAEHTLCLNGIRDVDAHRVLKDTLKVLTDTDIDE